MDCFSPGHSECKWCNTKYRVGLNHFSRIRAHRDGLEYTEDELKIIKRMTQEGRTDEYIGLQLGRSMLSVRGRRTRLGINKRVKAAPKPVFNEFVHIKEDVIKAVTVYCDGSKLTVYSNTNARAADIQKAFEDRGLTVDDCKAWRIGVAAGC